MPFRPVNFTSSSRTSMRRFSGRCSWRHVTGKPANQPTASGLALCETFGKLVHRHALGGSSMPEGLRRDAVRACGGGRAHQLLKQAFGAVEEIGTTARRPRDAPGSHRERGNRDGRG